MVENFAFTGCVEVVKKMPPTPKHHFRKIRSTTKKTTDKQIAKDVLKKTHFTVSGNTLSFSVKSKQLFASFELSNKKFDIPMAVKVRKEIENSSPYVSESAESSCCKLSEFGQKAAEKDEVSSKKMYHKSVVKNETNTKQRKSKKANKSKCRKSFGKEKNIKEIEIDVEMPTNVSNDRQEMVDDDIAVIFSSLSPPKNESVKKKLSKKTEILEVPLPGKKRKLNENFEDEAPEKKKTKLSEITSTNISIKSSKLSPSSVGKKGLKSVDPNQKSILQYFFSASSPPTTL